MTKFDIEEELLSLKEILSTQSNDSKQCYELSQVVGDIPLQVCNFLYLSKSKSHSLIKDKFLGCDALTYNEVLEQYKNKSKKYSFFESWNVNDDYKRFIRGMILT